MQPQGVKGASLLMVALAAFACGEGQVDSPPPVAKDPIRTTRPERASSRKVLILESTVTGGTASREASAARKLGTDWIVDVVSREKWAAMTAEEFMTYRALILGDATCGADPKAMAAAVASRDAWGAVVDGNVVLVGTDPVNHRIEALTENAVKFAASVPGRTGMYISLSCYYQGTAAGTTVPLLEPFGDFTVAGVPCRTGDVHLFQMKPDTLSFNLSDEALGTVHDCAVREVFDRYPVNNFAPVAIAVEPSGSEPLPGSQLFEEYDSYTGYSVTYRGVPYILARGAMADSLGCGDGVPRLPEECDLGDNSNGRPGMPGGGELTCSWSCRAEWCGDGIRQEFLGEECDEGYDNGRTLTSSIGACSAFCKIPKLGVKRPPVALCRNLALVADNTCGASGSVDNGSYDPDGDLEGCTQSPAGPYGPGTTYVTLTCADSTGQESSCSATVSVTDGAGPVFSSCSPDVSAECVAGVATVASVTATDNCGPVTVTSSHGSNTFPLGGPYSVRYTATDSSGNTATCSSSVTVSDTKPPTLALKGASTQALECGSSYADPGATANDLCHGDLTHRITVSGSWDTSKPGSYTATYGVTDPSGHSATPARRTVVVSDTQAPSITCPPPIVAQCTGNGHGTVTPGVAKAADTCSAVQVSGPTATRYPVGITPVTYTAVDGSGNRASCTSTITVLDTRGPLVTVTGASPLWPPNHKYRTLSLADCGITVQDGCGGTMSLRAAQAAITCVSSDEPRNSGGDGNTEGDIVIVDATTVKLRAERKGSSDGRVYKIYFTVKDAGGNTAQGVCVAPVPHDQSGRPPVDSGESYRVCRSIASDM